MNKQDLINHAKEQIGLWHRASNECMADLYRSIAAAKCEAWRRIATSLVAETEAIDFVVHPRVAVEGDILLSQDELANIRLAKHIKTQARYHNPIVVSWVCAYCEEANLPHEQTCGNCGASKILQRQAE